MDLEIAEREFARRRQENAGKQIRNEDLVAGSPMYYYCHGCCILVDVKPETWVFNPPPKYCEACSELSKLGVLDRLIKGVK